LAQQRSACLLEWHSLQSDERDRLRMIDLLSFQVEEIEQAQLTSAEEDHLLAERLRLSNAEKLHDAATSSYALLYESDGGLSVLEALGEAQQRLAALTRFDAALDPVVEALDAAAVQITDACHELSAYRTQVQFDPERLEELEERLALIHALKRKYGETVDAILDYGATKRAELERLTHHEERRDEIRADIDRLEKMLAERALALSAVRKHMAGQLAAGIQQELSQLGMPKAVFQVNISYLPQTDGLPIHGEHVAVTAHGIDHVSFYISANAGEPPKPLAKVASGGELSRVMLALKTVSTHADGVPTLIFDEIDSGIGGRTAEAVGLKLAQVAKTAQVIAVTHLAQLAFYADKHFLIEKTSHDERTSSAMRELDHEERVEELARLQAGARVSDAVLTHVRSVLDDIHSHKNGTLF
jgi:DNA repair protein RecN (Recombination protein N)